jgi:hypothetical protein
MSHFRSPEQTLFVAEQRNADGSSSSPTEIVQNYLAFSQQVSKRLEAGELVQMSHPGYLAILYVPVEDVQQYLDKGYTEVPPQP